MSLEWYYQLMGEDIGPLSAVELHRLALDGRLMPDTYVRRNDSDRWVPAIKIDGLFNAAQTPHAMPPEDSALNPQVMEALGLSQLERPVQNSKLVYCPDCANAVSRRAPQCPNCGCPLIVSEPKPVAMQITQINHQPNRQPDPSYSLISSGYICAIVSLLFFPPAFGLAGFVCGVINLNKGQTGHGLAQIIISIAFASIGMLIGAASMS